MRRSSIDDRYCYSIQVENVKITKRFYKTINMLLDNVILTKYDAN